MSSRTARWLIVMMSLVTGARINAAPTTASSPLSCLTKEDKGGAGGDIDAKNPAQRWAGQSVSPASNLVVSLSRSVSAILRRDESNPTGSPSIDEVGLFSSTGNSALADIGAELLKPPADFSNLSSLPPGTRTLPAVPAALFMCLTGFLCVTLVRDRKVWLAALTAILWIGQAGFATLPKFASFVKREAYIEKNTRYALMEGIPVPANSEQRTAYTLNELRTPNNELRTTNSELRTTNKSPQFAINTVFFYLIQTTNCLAIKVEQFFCFSPAFIFEIQPRGPPTLA